ncbi:isoleucine--tRNA ligase [Candidatus Kuenenbacteria bacterium]|nr:isoleucine--tRNA ligase [Candidatus Kuenenbacteria bacterium]
MEKSFFAKIEEEILIFWKENKIFEKSIEQRDKKKSFVFYDGPPFITGLPHYATLLPSIAKDVVPRYWTMKGYRVERIWGWDCHGLPAENKVEEQLGLKNKKDIEELGIDKFIDACRSYVNKGSEQWEWYINRIGRWVDMKNAYKTMDLKFMESVIWSFKKLYDTGFIYEGYRTSLHCPRCATPLSKFEITMDAGSYRDVIDKSVVVKFRIKNSSDAKKDIGIDNNTYLLTWTTTPWTLPGNLALAVRDDIDYVKIEIRDHKSGIMENCILAKDKLVENFKDQKYEILENFKGRDLVDLEYESIYKLNNSEIAKSDKVYKVYSADFVTTEDGTGIVHIAPNFGEDDFRLGEKVGLSMIDLMDENGVYLESAGQWSGYYFKKANRDVLLDLEKHGVIFSSSDFTHSYPFCYRCGTPLIYKTQKAWYLDVQKIKTRMLETNKKINWAPEYFKEGRFKNNIESAPDWCLSRSRYWGSPIPVWKCSDCDKIKVLGSIEEIEKLSGEEVKDLHRPNIDKHELKCECGNVMKRVKEVFDCWFESGAMPFAQFHYPFERQDYFKNMFPADFIIEYSAQLRGWFYYLHVLSNALFNSVSFKNVVVTGVLAGTDGRKMSKSFGNYPDPAATLEKYGSDALRMYFMNSSIMLGDDTSLSEIDIQDALRKNVIVLWNVVKFYELFMSPDDKISTININGKENILDIWILIRLNQLIKEVTENLEKYNLPEASRPISGFIDDLSTWYLRRSRDRFKGEDEKDKQNVIATTKFILIELAKVMAPFTPFITEQIWQKVAGYNFENKDKSVHLEKWPELSQITDFELEILEQMKKIRKIVELGLRARDETGIKVRQTLQKLLVISDYKLQATSYKLIKDELNVKEIEFIEGDGELKVELDTKITPELKQEGLFREIIRQINSLRKEVGLTIKDKIDLYYFCEEGEIKKVFEKFKEQIKKAIICNQLLFVADSQKKGLDFEKEIKIEEQKVWIGMIKKIKS